MNVIAAAAAFRQTVFDAGVWRAAAYDAQAARLPDEFSVNTTGTGTFGGRLPNGFEEWKGEVMPENMGWFGANGDVPPDIARRITLAMASIQAKIAAMAAGICPACQHPMTLDRHGEEVYAMPCGHRLY